MLYINSNYSVLLYAVTNNVNRRTIVINGTNCSVFDFDACPAIFKHCGDGALEGNNQNDCGLDRKDRNICNNVNINAVDVC